MTNLLRSIAALGLALAMAAPLAATAATLPAGSTVTGTLGETLDTKSASDGDRFALRVVPPYPNGDSTYANAIVYGHVRNVVRAGQGRKAQMQLAFDRIVLANGRSAPLSGTVTSTQSKKENTVLRTAAGTVVGDLVGNYLGKHVGGPLGNIGWVLGAAGGYLYASNIKANFSVPSGSTVQLRTNNTVSPSSRRQS